MRDARYSVVRTFPMPIVAIIPEQLVAFVLDAADAKATQTPTIAPTATITPTPTPTLTPTISGPKPSEYWICGKVLSPEGTLVQSGQISLQAPEQQASLRGTVEGSYSYCFKNLPGPSFYELTVRAQFKYADQTAKVEVRTEGITKQDFLLTLASPDTLGCCNISGDAATWRPNCHVAQVTQEVCSQRAGNWQNDPACAQATCEIPCDGSNCCYRRIRVAGSNSFEVNPYCAELPSNGLETNPDFQWKLDPDSSCGSIIKTLKLKYPDSRDNLSVTGFDNYLCWDWNAKDFHYYCSENTWNSSSNPFDLQKCEKFFPKASSCQKCFGTDTVSGP